MDKRVLIIYENIGSGHKKTAEAVKKAFLKHNGVIVDIKNPFEERFPGISKFSIQFYLNTIKYTPELWSYIYETERNKVEKKFNIFLGKSIYTFIKKYILKFQPDVIICTHPFSCAFLYQIKKNLNIPVYAILTDYDVHAYWIYNYIDGYFVGCNDMKKKMLNMGIQNEKIYVTGIPIDEIFYVYKDKNKIRKKLGFKNDLPIIIIMGGGLGLGSIENAVKILQKNKSYQFAVICGYNKKLENKISEIAEENVHVYGHIENIDEFMSIADLLITKSGGITITEAITKRLPIAVFDTLPGQEVRNLKFLLKMHMAVRIKDINYIDSKIVELFKQNKRKINFIKSNMGKMNFIYSSNQIAEIILNNISKFDI
ncbi:MAG: MGDG synthase family glycosyltransferase [Thermoanaerobacteraceae bacterium]